LFALTEQPEDGQQAGLLACRLTGLFWLAASPFVSFLVFWWLIFGWHNWRAAQQDDCLSEPSSRGEECQ
jgi:hypothetical protein